MTRNAFHSFKKPEMEWPYNEPKILGKNAIYSGFGVYVIDRALKRSKRHKIKLTLSVDKAKRKVVCTSDLQEV